MRDLKNMVWLRTRVGVIFLFFWSLCLLVFFVRIGFDLQTYATGSTIIFRNSPKSGYDYLLHLPRGYTDFGGKRPLILFLHGAGETGTDVRLLKKSDIFHYSHGSINPADFPFIVVTPVTPKHGWEPQRIMQLLDELLADDSVRWKIDSTRIYLTGLSMGGFGTFRIACEYPARFAAIAPICGGGDVAQAERLKSVPTWIFHGDSDDVVSWKCSSEMAEAMRSAGCDEVIFTTIQGGGHGIWREIYENPELYQWFLKHQRNP